MPENKHLLKYKNNQLGKRCFVVGSDPSLRKLDLPK